MSKEQLLKNLGYQFRKARLSTGLSQVDLANKIGKDQPSINRLEMGNVNPSYVFLIEVCQGLEMNLVEVLGLD